MNAHANLRSQQKDYVCLISYGLEQIHKNVMAIVPTKALLTFQQFITVTGNDWLQQSKFHELHGSY